MIYNEVYCQNEAEGITHYIFPEFVDGTVLMKNGISDQVSINYNSLTEQMIFERGSVKLAIGEAESKLIDTIYMKNRKFVRLGDDFVEVLSADNEVGLFIEYKCKLSILGRPVGLGRTSSTTNVDTYSSIQGDGRAFDLKLPEEYGVDPYHIYWVKMDRLIYEVTSLKRLERLFKKRKDQFREYVREHNVSFDEPNDIRSLVNYMNK